jgi:hypothetical protein
MTKTVFLEASGKILDNVNVVASDGPFTFFLNSYTAIHISPENNLFIEDLNAGFNGSFESGKGRFGDVSFDIEVREGDCMVVRLTHREGDMEEHYTLLHGTEEFVNRFLNMMHGSTLE